MRSFNISRVYDRHTRAVAAAIGLLVATLVPAMAPVFVSADQVTARSVALSSSSKAATGVTYSVAFTADNASAGAVVVQFCSDTPLIGEDCTAPTGFTAASAVGGGGATVSGSPTANKVIVTKAITASANTFTLSNITNPTAAGSLYVRIATYADTTDAGVYSTDGQTLGSIIDQGSVALSITDSIGVTGDVLETMTFCVSGADTITAGCASGVTAPTLEIGELSGSVRSLSAGALSTASVYTQISTNAVGGAVVSLKSNTTGCGGLSRLGASDFAAGCGIVAAGTTGTIAAADAKIGIRTATATDEGTATGTFQPASGSAYDTSNYRLNYVAGNATGVTSTYGDPFLDTGDAPASNKEMALEFGASIAPSTPAGRYTANYNLIATGTF